LVIPKTKNTTKEVQTMTNKIKQHQIKVTLPAGLYDQYVQLVLETTFERNLSQFTRGLIRRAVKEGNK